MKYFPVILTQQRKKKIQAFSALKLESILQGELLIANSRVQNNNISALNKMNPNILQNTRESFIQSISQLDESLSLELSIASYPNLANAAGNKLEIIFFICGEDKSDEMIKEKIISAFLNIKPIITALFPEADFRPVSSLKVLKEMRKYNNFKNAVSIDRKFKKIALRSPFGLKEIGFGAKVGTEIKQPDKTVLRHIFQWIPSNDDWSNLINVMLNQIDPTRIVIRLKNAPLKERTLINLKKTISACDCFLASLEAENLTLKEQALLIRQQTITRIEKLMGDCFNLGVFLLSSNRANSFLGKILGNAITGLKDKTNKNTFWQGGFQISNVSIDKVIELNYFYDKEPFTATEASCAFRLPNPPFGEVPAGFPVKNFRTALAMISGNNKDKNSLFIGKNNHKGVEQPVVIDNESRFRHCFLLGQTGTGKSTLMSNMIIQDIQAGRGVAVIDPHGDMIDDILGRIPLERAEDVILFDPLDTGRPIGFNVLEWNTIQERDLIVDEIYQILHQIYDLVETGGPIFELYFRGALALLMGDHKREFTSTILDFAPFFLDEDFRKYLKDSVNDVNLHDFLKQAERASGDVSMNRVAPYIISKFARFQDATLKRIIGQSRTTFNIEEIMNTGKIFLIKLGKGRFGGVTSALLANMIVSRIKLAAMKRGELSPSKRREFFIYIDEAHNLPAENFMELLSEARKYRLGLVLATQYAAQLTKSSVGTRDNLLSALLGNVGQTIVFRLGQEDAKKMAASFEPSFAEQDIIALPNWHGYVRMQQKNNALSPFSIKTSVNKTPYHSGTADKIKTLSRLKYGMDSSVVDQAILQRRSVWKEYIRG